jgi:hypothetical protein
VPFVCGEYGLAWRYSAPCSAQALAKIQTVGSPRATKPRPYPRQFRVR